MNFKEVKKDKRDSFFKNCCRMWNYRKIVSQSEQYEFNMKKIEEWKQMQQIESIAKFLELQDNEIQSGSEKQLFNPSYKQSFQNAKAAGAAGGSMARARALLEAYNCGHDTIITEQQFTISDSHTSVTVFPHLSSNQTNFLEQIEAIQETEQTVDG